ncbi:hypothetical protein HKBW3S42_01187 [Candidatus Hakubella thermalkaliphila]|uniref:Uncharacterized protein n=1 Tax=Candidatus Hakubella thermalkaliphila TaxID=2754717 RepID=A0A6V8PL85_9ACTN|nr:hypothetical protein HKBW3S42_01187 [Candidatus Hakubella thermalkaliphila]GFP42928.1 hypothetical protein HKBW3C_02060 [Candidatus Hakubella thermalkaliphila]
MNGIAAIFGRCLKHGQDIGGRDVVLNVVSGVEHITTPWRKVQVSLFYLLADLFGSPKGQDILSVHPPPQKTRSLPNSLFSLAESMLCAETCTGFRISTPICIISGINS